MIRIFYSGAALGLLAWAVFWPGFRDREGLLTSGFCFAAALVVAMAAAAAASGTRWMRAAGWFSVAAAGQAAALQTISAGTAIRFQHYKSPAEIASLQHGLVLASFAIQTALVLMGLRGKWTVIGNWARRALKPWQMIAILAALAATAACMSRDVAFYSYETAFVLTVELVNLGNAVLIAWYVPDEALGRMEGYWDTLSQRRSIALGAAVWITCLTALLSFVVYERHPHIPDEVSYVYQARYLAAGMLTMPAVPALEPFRLDLMTYEPGRWYSPFPPGWPAMLAIGELLRVPWLINPLLAGLTAFGIWLFVRDAYGHQTAGLVLLLLCISPWFLFMGMNFMSHMAALACTVGAALAIQRARSSGRAGWAVLAGASTGIASTIRPLDGFLIAVLLGLWLMGVGAWSAKARTAAGFALGCVLTGVWALPYNQHLTGSALKFPVDAYFDKYYGPGVNSLGFGPHKGMNWPIDPFPGHGWRDVVVNNSLNATATNTELLGWSTGSLLPLFLLAICTVPSLYDRRMLVWMLAFPAVYCLYWYSGGPDFGARYWFSILPACLVLTAGGLNWLRKSVGMQAAPRVYAAVVALCLLTLVNYLPWRAIDKYHHYLRMSPEVLHLANSHQFGRSLVLVHGQQHPDYASAAIYNPLNFSDAAPIYVWDRNPETRAKAMEIFPDRPVWTIDGPSVTGKGFAVVGGPAVASKRKENP